MKLVQLKDMVAKEFAIKALGVLYVVIKVIDKFQKEETQDIKMFKFKTRHHHVRLIQDRSSIPCMLIREKGFFKEWNLIDQIDMPKCLVEDIFETTCSDEKRKRLIDKMMRLKAFW